MPTDGHKQQAQLPQHFQSQHSTTPSKGMSALWGPCWDATSHGHGRYGQLRAEMTRAWGLRYEPPSRRCSRPCSAALCVTNTVLSNPRVDRCCWAVAIHSRATSTSLLGSSTKCFRPEKCLQHGDCTSPVQAEDLQIVHLGVMFPIQRCPHAFRQLCWGHEGVIGSSVVGGIPDAMTLFQDCCCILSRLFSSIEAPLRLASVWTRATPLAWSVGSLLAVA
jgi:hypothetical protein